MHHPNTFPAKETKITLNGEAGYLEAITAMPKQGVHSGVAIVCHPHPLHGGTLDNKVVTTLSRAFLQQGIACVRFNFRGVGNSHGSYAKGLGGIQDLLAISQWTQQVCPQQSLWLAGFSFGSFVSIKAATALKPVGLISVAPPIGRWDFGQLIEPTCPWLIIQGDKDEVVNSTDVYQWAEQRSAKPQVIKFADTSHFFHGKLGQLKHSASTFIAANTGL